MEAQRQRRPAAPRLHLRHYLPLTPQRQQQEELTRRDFLLRISTSSQTRALAAPSVVCSLRFAVSDCYLQHATRASDGRCTIDALTLTLPAYWLLKFGSFGLTSQLVTNWMKEERKPYREIFKFFKFQVSWFYGSIA